MLHQLAYTLNPGAPKQYPPRRRCALMSCPPDGLTLRPPAAATRRTSLPSCGAPSLIGGREPAHLGEILVFDRPGNDAPHFAAPIDHDLYRQLRIPLNPHLREPAV